MPRVPQIDSPTVAPSAGTLNVSASPEAFGASIGREEAKTGAEISQLGDMLGKHAIEMQGRENQRLAKDAFVGATIEQGEIENWYRNLEGAAAANAYPEYVQRVKAVRQKYLDNMPNDEARRLFDNDFTRREVFSIVDGARYAATQNKRAIVQSNQAVVQTTADAVATNPDSDEYFDYNSGLALKALKSQAQEYGWTPEVYKVKEGELVSNLWSARIGALAKTDLNKAREVYQANKGKIRPDDQTQVENKFLKSESDVAAQHNADQFNMKQKVKGDLASVEESGQGIPNITFNEVKQSLGEKAAQEWQFQRDVKTGVWRATHDMPTLTPVQLSQRTDSLMPAAGDKDYLAKHTIWQAAKSQAQDILELRNADPALAVTKDPEVEKAKAALTDDPASMQSLMRARMAAQERAGVVEPSPITKDEALRAGMPLRRMLPGEERATLKELGETYKKQFGEFADEALVYTFKALKVDAATAQAAGRMMRGMFPAEPAPGSAPQPLRTATEVGAAEASMPKEQARLPSRGAIEALKADPTKAAEFDAKYGAGQAEKALKIYGIKVPNGR